MGASDERSVSATGRREPPAFRRVAVLDTVGLTSHMVRVTVGGPDLDGFRVTEPAASVRLLLPFPGAGELAIPKWNGNEFLLADGTRPIIRTFTPRRFDTAALTVDLDMVLHEGGVASAWAESGSPGDRAALSGPGRGYKIDPDASAYLLVGDESAIPAIAQLLEHIPATIAVHVHIEIGHPDARLVLPDHPLAVVEWHELPSDAPPGDAVVAAVAAATVDDDWYIWCAGEAAAMHRIRTNLFKERGMPRSQATVRGYWKA